MRYLASAGVNQAENWLWVRSAPTASGLRLPLIVRMRSSAKRLRFSYLEDHPSPLAASVISGVHSVTDMNWRCRLSTEFRPVSDVTRKWSQSSADGGIASGAVDHGQAENVRVQAIVLKKSEFNTVLVISQK
ncbi:MAG: hypothetical protein HQ492_01385 [Woeseiaceae bacterium]|nr:hypothetical protein [Woeseiaceae bacterium]